MRFTLRSLTGGSTLYPHGSSDRRHEFPILRLVIDRQLAIVHEPKTNGGLEKELERLRRREGAEIAAFLEEPLADGVYFIGRGFVQPAATRYMLTKKGRMAVVTVSPGEEARAKSR